MAVGSGWQLAVGRRWRLAAVGGWRLVAVGGWWSLGAVLKAGLSKKKKSRPLRTALRQPGLPDLPYGGTEFTVLEMLMGMLRPPPPEARGPMWTGGDGSLCRASGTDDVGASQRQSAHSHAQGPGCGIMGKTCELVSHTRERSSLRPENPETPKSSAWVLKNMVTYSPPPTHTFLKRPFLTGQKAYTYPHRGDDILGH